MVSIIHEAAKIYDAELCHKNLLIIFGAPNAPEYIQTKATERNFCHLTGVKLNLAGNNALDLFYAKAKDGNLSVNDFEINQDGTTQLKMLVIKQALNISKNAKMIGDFNNGRLKLKANKITGSISSCIGFVKQDGFFIPNTILNDDTRNNTKINQRVLAVLGKETSEREYGHIKYVAKKIDINLLLKKLEKSVNIDKSLIGEDEVSQSTLMQISITEKNNILPNISVQGDGTAVIVPTTPQNNLFNQFINSLIKCLDTAVHRASAAVEKTNQAIRSITAPKPHSEPRKALQNQNKDNSITKKQPPEMATPITPVKPSAQKQDNPKHVKQPAKPNAPLFSRAAQKSFSEAAKANTPERNGKDKDDIGIE